MLVRWLSDPDNLNQLVVSQLDRVTPKSSVCGSDLDLPSLASQEGDGSEAWVAASLTSVKLTWRRRRRRLQIPPPVSEITNDLTGLIFFSFFFFTLSEALRNRVCPPAPRSRPKLKVRVRVWVCVRSWLKCVNTWNCWSTRASGVSCLRKARGGWGGSVRWLSHDVWTRVGSITGCCCQLPASA